MSGLCRPGRACFFLFLPISSFSQPPFSEWRRTGFLHLGLVAVLDSSTTGPHASNRACSELRWCCFPIRLPKPHTGPHGGRVCFSPQNELTPPPKGEGLGIAFLGFVGFALLVHKRLTRLQQHLSGAALVSFPYPAPKTAHRATQGRGWFHRLFLVRFFCGSPASCCSRWQFTASWMGKIV